MLFKVTSLSILAVIVIALLHGVFPSMLNNFRGPSWPPVYDDTYINLVIQFHREFPPFQIRPMTTWAIELATYLVKTTPVWSFMVVNLSALALCGVLIGAISQRVSLTAMATLTSTGVFYASLTVVFAFFTSIDTYDEPLQYVLLLLTILFLISRKVLPCALSLALACLTRESSLILFPSFLIIARQLSEGGSPRRFLSSSGGLLISLPIFVMVKALIIIPGGRHQGVASYLRTDLLTHWAFNTGSLASCVETVVMIFGVLGLPLFAITALLRAPSSSSQQRSFAWAAVLGILINTSIVLFTGRVREARILALPLLFFWPIAGHALHLWWRQVRASPSTDACAWPSQSLGRAGRIVLATLTLVIAVWLIYRPTQGGGFERGYQVYLTGLVLLLASMTFISARARSG